MAVDELSEVALSRILRGRPYRLLTSTGSTNDEAAAWAEEGAPEGAVVVAEHQTGGRGRWGRTWLSLPGRGLLFSLILRPAGRIDALGLLTTALGVACAEGIDAATGLAAGLKWPNDVSLGGRKVGGILTETKVSGSMVTAAICGIGINVAWDPAEMPEEIAGRATSLVAELRAEGRGGPVSRAELLGAILEAFEALYPEGLSAAAAPDLVARAAGRSEVLGREVSIRYPSGRVLTGVAIGLSPSGALEIEAEGQVLAVDGGEIAELRPAGARQHPPIRG